MTEQNAPRAVAAHPTLLRRGFLLCQDSATVVAIPEDTGVCPVHNTEGCALWYVPWADVRSQS